MSKVFFNANNRVGETMSLKTASSSATTFDLTIAFITEAGSARVGWDFGDGSGILVGNAVSYTYADSGITKTATLRTNKLSNIKSFSVQGDAIVGNLDMTGFDNLGGDGGYFMNFANPLLTSVTHSYSEGLLGAVSFGYALYSCDITGIHDMTSFPNLVGSFRMNQNPNLTGILHTGSSQTFTTYYAYSCDLTGNHDVSMLSGLGGDFRVYSNPNLTAITHGYSPTTFTRYQISSCDITGNHDMTGLVGLGGVVYLFNNSNLTGITHTASTQTFTSYHFYDCNITGNHDVSMLSGLGGSFFGTGNPNLTGITHGPSNPFTSYQVYNCNLTGNHDLSMITLGGSVSFQNNPNLTGITHSGSSQNITSYIADTCDLTGTHDISMLSGLTGFIQIYGNVNLTNILYPSVDIAGSKLSAYSCGFIGNHDMSALSGVGSIELYSNVFMTGVTHAPSTQAGLYSIQGTNLMGTLDISMLTGRDTSIRTYNTSGLTDIIFPVTTGTFLNTFSSSGTKAFNLEGCDFGYINFYPLSGATMNTGSTYGASINLQNNNMTSGEVNHILYDLNAIATADPSKWAGVILDISGTNAAPDGSSGGYDGITAAANLVTNGWTVTTT